MADVGDLSVAELRQFFHAIPESGYLEFETANHIVTFLEGCGATVEYGDDIAADTAGLLGFPEQDEVGRAWRAAAATVADRPIHERLKLGQRGVVATFVPEQGDVQSTIGFRFDIDALPIVEASQPNHEPFARGYASKRAGFMHACGHDGHIAIGLGLARWIASHPPTNVRVVLLFQAAEEGCRGASALASSAHLRSIDELYCLHLGMGAPSGVVYPSVTSMFATTKYRCIFTGRAAHAAASPELGRNALLAACHAILALFALPPFAGVETRVNVGSVSAPNAPNVIASDARFDVEVRAATSDVEEELRDRVLRAIAAAAQMYEVDVSWRTTGHAPALVCDAPAINRVESALTSLGLPTPEAAWIGSGSDDASTLLDAVRQHGGIGTYIVVGADLAGPHHSPAFDFDERSLNDGVRVLCRILALADSA